MTKEEKIKEVWGEYYDLLKQNIKHNGWIENINIYSGVKINLEFNGFYSRPKELQGIENNNGWIKIESEDDLPKEELDVHFIFTEFKGEEGRFQTFGVWDNKLKSFYSGALKIKTVTHYQTIEKPKPPIY